MSGVTAAWVRRAHGDAWEAVGRAREGTGGGACVLPGVRLMATGLPHPQWNNGDVHDAAVVAVDHVREWYSALNVPWGLRVPAGDQWHHGRRLFGKRLMGALPPHVSPAAAGRRPGTAPRRTQRPRIHPRSGRRGLRGAARIYDRLGFVEVDGFDINVDN